MRTKMKSVLAALALAAAGSLAAPAMAFPIEAQLTGDPRPGNPDSLIIDVDIVLIDANTVEWTIDINSPLHPNARLDEFYFNVTGLASDYTFDSFSPTDWAITSPASVQGGGSFTPNFLFSALDPSGPPNAADVNNTTNLVFRMNLVSGSFADSMFLTAANSCSSDTTLGCGQLGAHVQSLTLGNPGDSATSDSGFVLGTYLLPSPPPLPEPGTLSLLGAIFLALGLLRLRQRRR